MAFTGTVPAIGAPLSGSGIGTGAQVTGVVGTGSSAIDTTLQTSVSSSDTSITLLDSTGILEGMAINNGTGTSTFVANIEGNVVGLTAPLTANLVGDAQTYTNVSGTNINPAGASAEFSVARLAGIYDSVTPTTAGTGYRVTDRITILGTDLGGASPANDISAQVTGIDGSGGITSVSFTGCFG